MWNELSSHLAVGVECSKEEKHLSVIGKEK